MCTKQQGLAAARIGCSDHVLCTASCTGNIWHEANGTLLLCMHEEPLHERMLNWQECVGVVCWRDCINSCNHWASCSSANCTAASNLLCTWLPTESTRLYLYRPRLQQASSEAYEWNALVGPHNVPAIACDFLVGVNRVLQAR